METLPFFGVSVDYFCAFSVSFVNLRSFHFGVTMEFSKDYVVCLLTHRFCRICKTYASHVLSTKKHSTILRFFLNGQAPKYLIRDNDRKFGPSFARAANTSGIRVLLSRAVCGYPLSS